MSEYTAPLRDMQFVLRELAPLEQVAKLPGCEEVSLELADAILEEAGKLAAGVLSPINASGDREGARWHGGQQMRRVLEQMRDVQGRLARADDERLGVIAGALRDGIAALEQATQFIVDTYGRDVKKASVGAVPFLHLFGTVAGGWQMGRAALVAQQQLREGTGDAAFLRAKLETARFYADHVLARAAGLAHTVVHGADAALAIGDDQF